MPLLIKSITGSKSVFFLRLLSEKSIFMTSWPNIISDFYCRRL